MAILSSFCETLVTVKVYYVQDTVHFIHLLISLKWNSILMGRNGCFPLSEGIQLGFKASQ